MIYADLVTKIIDAGIEAARADYGKRADKPEMLRGAIDGFEACRGKQPREIAELWQRAERSGMLTGDSAAYWYARCKVAEIEWVANVVSVGLQQQGLPPILSWLPTARGVLKYAEIVGVSQEAST